MWYHGRITVTNKKYKKSTDNLHVVLPRKYLQLNTSDLYMSTCLPDDCCSVYLVINSHKARDMVETGYLLPTTYAGYYMMVLWCMRKFAWFHLRQLIVENLESILWALNS